MNFTEAILHLNEGKKITRTGWSANCYFALSNNEIKCYTKVQKCFRYDESIMVSDGWYVDDNDTPMKFCEIIPYLMQGKTARLAEWKHSYISYDKSSKESIINSEEELSFVPDFESFVQNDWVVIDELG